MGALGADRAGETGAHPGQVVSAIVPAHQVGGRVVLTSCRRGGRGGYGRVGSGTFLSLGGIGRARCNNESIADRLRRFTQLGVRFWAQLPHPATRIAIQDHRMWGACTAQPHCLPLCVVKDTIWGPGMDAAAKCQSPHSRGLAGRLQNGDERSLPGI